MIDLYARWPIIDRPDRDEAGEFACALCDEPLTGNESTVCELCGRDLGTAD